MPFDPNLDKKVFSEVKDFDKTRLTVSIMSYNDGPKKLQIGRENKTAAGEYQFAKMGRLGKEEIEAILPLIEKAMKHM